MMNTLFEKIQQAQTIIIHRHVNPDPDAFGSQGGLAQLIRDNAPEKTVYCVGQAEPTLSHLLTPIEIDDACYEGALVIVTDTANQERIDDQRFALGAQLLKIDHHPNNDVYGDWQWVNTEASSTSQLILQFALYAQAKYQWQISAAFAELVYAGIIADTGRFMYSHVNKQLFLEVAEIIDLLDLREFYQTAYKRTISDVQFSGYLTQSLQVTPNGCGYVKITQAELNRFGVSRSKASSMVNMLANIEGIYTWAFFTEDSENQNVRCSLRSRGPIVNEIAQQFDGGGHPLASGARVANWNEIQQVLDLLDAACFTYQQQNG
ncbi:MAG: DHH family phosphoesterase [Culicoidibacterales bacterium]